MTIMRSMTKGDGGRQQNEKGRRQEDSECKWALLKNIELPPVWRAGIHHGLGLGGLCLLWCLGGLVLGLGVNLYTHSWTLSSDNVLNIPRHWARIILMHIIVQHSCLHVPPTEVFNPLADLHHLHLHFLQWWDTEWGQAQIWSRLSQTTILLLCGVEALPVLLRWGACLFAIMEQRFERDLSFSYPW